MASVPAQAGAWGVVFSLGEEAVVDDSRTASNLGSGAALGSIAKGFDAKGEARVAPKGTDTRASRGGRGEEADRSADRSADRAEDQAIRTSVGAGFFSRYFDGQARAQLIEGKLELVVPSQIVAQMLDRRFGDQLRQASGALRGSTGEVRFRVDRTAFHDGKPAADHAPAMKLDPKGGGRDGGREPAREMGREVGREARPAKAAGVRLRMEEFLVGTSNRLAHSAVLRATDDDDFSGSVFLHGPCGMGKSHLLQAAATRFLDRKPGALVRYTTAEAFTNEFIAAIKVNKVDVFRKAYRKLHMLCLDDVHFFSNKDSTQTELLHTFDAIGMQGSRVLMASDEHPREIQRLSSHLVSRFMAGAVCRIETPDRELRERLVRHLGAKRGLQLEDAAVNLLVERSAMAVGTLNGFGGSVRELDGLLIQVEAVRRLLPEFAGGNGAIGVMLVRKALGLGEVDRSATRVRRPIPLETIVGEVCRCLTVDRVEFVGKGRHKRVVLARAVCGHLCRKLTTLSYPEIARGMGRPNHSTIITACKRLGEDLSRPDLPPFEDDIVLGLPADMRGLTLTQLVDAIADRIVRSAP